MKKFQALEILDAVKRTGDPGSTEALTAAIVRGFGGIDKLAGEIIQQYKEAPDGSMIKGNLLRAVIELLKHVDGRRPPQDEMDALTEEQLHREAERLLKDHSRKLEKNASLEF